jgi:hypothetical protein
MEDTTPLPVFPTLLIREAQLPDHSKLIHYPMREWVWRDGEEVVICRSLCGSEDDSPIAGDMDSIVTCKECLSLARRMRHRMIVG